MGYIVQLPESGYLRWGGGHFCDEANIVLDCNNVLWARLTETLHSRDN